MDRSASPHRVLFSIAITLTLIIAMLPPAWAADEQLKSSARATKLLKESEQDEQLIAQAQQSERQAEQALQQANKALQLSRELQDAEAEAVAHEAVATATMALAKARSNLVIYTKRRDAAVAALGRSGRGDVAMSISDILGEVYLRTKVGLVKFGLNFKLQEGDTIVTGKDSNAVFSLEDGSRIEIGANTTLTAGDLTYNEISLKLLAGRIKSTVEKLAGRRFQIHTMGARAAVRGTEFSTEVLHGVTTIRVQSGEVEVTATKDGAQITVKEGQRAIIQEDGTIIGPLPEQQESRPSV